ncbi:MAG: universal stress protein [Bacteroidales bacterium]
MHQNRIIVPIDFTIASEQAIAQSLEIARKANLTIMLLHILTKESKSSQVKKGMDSLDTEERLKNMANSISEQEGIHCIYNIVPGDIFEEIPVLTNKTENALMVIGTHGIQGIKQKILGADILKLVRKISIPCLIVQENCICKNFSPIVFPVGGHEGFNALIDGTAMIAELFGSEVHIYSIDKKGDTESKEIRTNIQLSERIFAEKKIPYQRIKEDSNVFSVGYAKQTLQYAHKVNAGLISIMSVKSSAHYYFAQADKESMINNEFEIPVLCANGMFNY